MTLRAVITVASTTAAQAIAGLIYNKSLAVLSCLDGARIKLISRCLAKGCSGNQRLSSIRSIIVVIGGDVHFAFGSLFRFSS